MRSRLTVRAGFKPAPTLLTAAFWLALAFTLSCDAASNPSALAGRWVKVSGYSRDEVMELLSDGTGVVTRRSEHRYGSSDEGVAITWKTENGRFYVTALGGAEAKSYKVSGSVLTFTDDEGDVSKYAKCDKKSCQEAAKEYAEAEEVAKRDSIVKAIKAKGKSIQKGTFTDSRDGKKYKTLKLGDQTWMAENLNYNADGSKCYKNQDGNCKKYGHLYNWSTAKSACPSGWHLPSDAEWETLVDLAGGSEVAGKILKASSDWRLPSDAEWQELVELKGGGEAAREGIFKLKAELEAAASSGSGKGVDAVGFSALPGGVGYSDGMFHPVGYFGGWWSATELTASLAWLRNMDHINAKVGRDTSVDKSYFFSVRCVQD